MFCGAGVPINFMTTLSFHSIFYSILLPLSAWKWAKVGFRGILKKTRKLLVAQLFQMLQKYSCFDKRQTLLPCCLVVLLPFHWNDAGEFASFFFEQLLACLFNFHFSRPWDSPSPFGWCSDCEGRWTCESQLRNRQGKSNSRNHLEEKGKIFLYFLQF